MSRLTTQEIAVLAKAGFDAASLSRLQQTAVRTPWLDHVRWAARHQFWLFLLPMLAIVAATQLSLDRPTLLVLLFTAVIAPLLLPYARRMLSWATDPDGSAARTALVLAVRADPDDGAGRGFDFHKLKELAVPITAAGDRPTGLNVHRRTLRTSRLRLLGVVGAMTATLFVVAFGIAVLG